MSALLSELKPRISAPGKPYQSLRFLCPACRGHQCVIHIWNGNAGVVDFGDGNPTRVWNAKQEPGRGFDDLTIQPSIDIAASPKRDCPGWHGFITNGKVEP